MTLPNILSTISVLLACGGVIYCMVGRCKHVWNTTDKIAVFEGFGYKPANPTYHKIILTCKKCGKIKKVKI